MRSVSDIGATAPISALTYTFSIGSNRGLQAAGFGLESSACHGRGGIEDRFHRIEPLTHLHSE